MRNTNGEVRVSRWLARRRAEAHGIPGGRRRKFANGCVRILDVGIPARVNARFLCLAVFVACAPAPFTPQPTPEDSGVDAGTSPIDAGEADAGAVVVVDAGLPDAGDELDAGVLVTPDAGVTEVCDAVSVAPLCPRSGWCWRNPAPFAFQLNDVIAFGCQAWAVGTSGLIVSRTSAGWVAAPSITTETLNGITGAAPNDLWAVGNHATIAHFDGVAWRLETSGTLSADFRSVSSPEPGLLVIAGSDALYQFERGALTTLHAPPRFSFKHVKATSRTSIRALGEEYVPNVDRRAVSVVFDGTQWRTEKSISTSSMHLNRLEQVGSRWFAAGSMNGHGPNYGYVDQLSPNPSSLPYTAAATEFLGLAATGLNAMLAVGRGVTSSIFSFDGTTYAPIADAPKDTLTSVAFGGREAFTVGQTLGRVVNGRYLAESSGWLGSANSVLALPNDELWLSGGVRSIAGGPFLETSTAMQGASLGPVVGESNTELWATGSGGVWHFDGTAWSRDPLGPTTRMNGVRVKDGDVWAWKWNEVWIKLAGGQWQQQPVASSMSIDDLWPVGNGLANVIGSGGGAAQLWVSNGTRFSAQPLPALTAGDGLRAVRGTWLGAWLLTWNGAVFHYDGTQWSSIAIPGGASLNELVNEGNAVIAVGREGAVLEWNGTSFVSLNLGIPVDLVGADVDANGALWVSGAGGTVAVRR